MEETTSPDCSTWKIWEGPEIEGYTDLNVRTLFIREATRQQVLSEIEKGNHNRVWFCEEYNDLEDEWLKRLSTSKENLKLVFGCTLKKYFSLSNFVKKNFQLYIQLNDLELKENDHVKIGKLFYEESFLMGQGKKSNPQLYSNDIKIL